MPNPRMRRRRPIALALAAAPGLILILLTLLVLELGTSRTALAQTGPPGARPAGTSVLPAPLSGAAVSITGISVGCGSTGGYGGTVTLSGAFTGSVILGLFYHAPGNGDFVDSGVRATATFVAWLVSHPGVQAIARERNVSRSPSFTSLARGVASLLTHAPLHR